MGSRSQTWKHLLTGAVAVAAGALSVGAQMAPGGGPPGGGPPGGPPGGGPGSSPAPAPPPPTVTAFDAEDERWAWLSRTGEDVELHAGGRQGESRVIARGKGWAEVALDGDAAWILRREEGRGALLRAPLSGGDPVEVLGGLERPAGLRADAAGLLWLETPLPSLPGHPFIPAAGTTRLCLRDASGTVRTLGAVPRVETTGQGDVIGVLRDAVYLRLHRGRSTEFLRLPLSGGAPVRLTVERGLQEGLLSRDTFYWTAPSREMDPDNGRSVMRMGPEVEPEWITDWLPASGRLVASGDGLFYAADVLYRLPRRLEAPVIAVSGAFAGLTSDGRGLVRTDRPGGPQPFDPKRERGGD